MVTQKKLTVGNKLILNLMTSLFKENQRVIIRKESDLGPTDEICVRTIVEAEVVFDDFAALTH